MLVAVACWYFWSPYHYLPLLTHVFAIWWSVSFACWLVIVDVCWPACLQRALELLALPPDGTPRLLLDIGCGSGLSGEALTEAGHSWVGLDISAAMLDVAVEREVRCRLC